MDLMRQPYTCKDHKILIIPIWACGPIISGRGFHYPYSDLQPWYGLLDPQPEEGPSDPYQNKYYQILGFDSRGSLNHYFWRGPLISILVDDNFFSDRGSDNLNFSRWSNNLWPEVQLSQFGSPAIIGIIGPLPRIGIIVPPAAIGIIRPLARIGIIQPLARIGIIKPQVTIGMIKTLAIICIIGQNRDY